MKFRLTELESAQRRVLMVPTATSGIPGRAPRPRAGRTRRGTGRRWSARSPRRAPTSAVRRRRRRAGVAAKARRRAARAPEQPRRGGQCEGGGVHRTDRRGHAERESREEPPRRDARRRARSRAPAPRTRPSSHASAVTWFMCEPNMKAPKGASAKSATAPRCQPRDASGSRRREQAPEQHHAHRARDRAHQPLRADERTEREHRRARRRGTGCRRCRRGRRGAGSRRTRAAEAPARRASRPRTSAPAAPARSRRSAAGAPKNTTLREHAHRAASARSAAADEEAATGANPQRGASAGHASAIAVVGCGVPPMSHRTTPPHVRDVRDEAADPARRGRSRRPSRGVARRTRDRSPRPGVRFAHREEGEREHEERDQPRRHRSTSSTRFWRSAGLTPGMARRPARAWPGVAAASFCRASTLTRAHRGIGRVGAGARSRRGGATAPRPSVRARDTRRT